MKKKSEVLVTNSSPRLGTSTIPVGSIESYAGVRRHAANIALITLMVVSVFWRVFFLGETLVDVRTLNNQLPWGYYAGEASDYPYNRRDLTDTYITRDYFVVASYRDGEMPLWNPYTMAGHPIYADGVTRTLSPFLMFYTFLDLPLGYSIARITELLLAAIFMYIFLVAIGVSPSGGLVGSLVFAFSAHSMLHVSGIGWWGGLMWLPLILLFVDRAVTRASFKHAILAGLFLAIQFLCGWMQNQIYYVGAVVLYYLFFGYRNVWRSTVMCAVTLLIGFGLAATQWMPVIELLKFSNRRIVPTEVSYIYLPPWYAATLIFPNLFGTAEDTNTLTLFTALNVSHDHILYLGIAALLPLAFSIYSLKRAIRNKAVPSATERSRLLLFALLAVLALLVMMAAPIYVHVTRFIPVLQVIRVTVRVWVIFIFAAAVLAAFGTDYLVKAGRDRLARFARLSQRFLYGAIAFVLLSVIASLIVKLTGFAANTGGSGRMMFVRRAAAALSTQFTPPGAAVFIPLALLGAVVLLARLWASAKLGRKAFLSALTALLVIDLYWISTQFNPTFDRSGVFPATQITDFLRSLPPGRVLVSPSDIETNRRASAAGEKIIAPPNTLLPYHISTVTGKNQQFPKWYREFASLIEPQPYLSHVVFDQTHSRYFDLLNVRYVITHASRPALADYGLLASAEGVSVYENKKAMPRAFFAGQVLLAESHEQTLGLMAEPAFDPRTTAVIEAQDLDFKSQNSNVAQNATIIEDKRNRVVIDAESPGGLLILSDNFYPGWRAYIDGARSEVFRANHTMRAVKVPAGRHVVSFEFDPAIFKISVYLSLATALVTLIALTSVLIREMRRRTHKEI